MHDFDGVYTVVKHMAHQKILADTAVIQLVARALTDAGLSPTLTHILEAVYDPYRVVSGSPSSTGPQGVLSAVLVCARAKAGDLDTASQLIAQVSLCLGNTFTVSCDHFTNQFVVMLQIYHSGI